MIEILFLSKSLLNCLNSYNRVISLIFRPRTGNVASLSENYNYSIKICTVRERERERERAGLSYGRNSSPSPTAVKDIVQKACIL